MFNILNNLTKTLVQTAIDVPVAVVNDVVTFGGILNEKDKPHTVEALEDSIKNLENTLKKN